MMNTTDPVIMRFRKALQDTYEERIERVVLYGSRARGDARSDSDYDIAVFLHDLRDRDAEVDRLAIIQSRFIDETNAVVHAVPFPAGGHHDTRRAGMRTF